eukprot:11405505-Prorocentrum_lima.AAC.1
MRSSQAYRQSSPSESSTRSRASMARPLLRSRRMRLASPRLHASSTHMLMPEQMISTKLGA